MKKECLLGVLCLIVAGLAGADYLTASIQTDGSVMFASAGSNQNGSFSSRAMAIDSSDVGLSIGGGENLDTDLTVRSSGPVLVSDYTSRRDSVFPAWLACAFNLQNPRDEEDSELFSSGILNRGVYLLSRSINPDLSESMFVNGSGLMHFGSQETGNTSLRSTGFVSGNMTIHEILQQKGSL